MSWRALALYAAVPRRSLWFPILVVAALAAAALAAIPAATAATTGSRAAVTTPVNVDISQRHLNESEETVAVNPADPGNIVTVTNVGHGEGGLSAGMLEGVSFDGGKTWATKLIGLGAGDPLGDACCDPSLRCRARTSAPGTEDGHAVKAGAPWLPA